MTYYLGVDQGSHASRAVLFDDNGNSVAAASLPVTTDRYGHGCVEHDAVQLLMSVQQAIQQVLSNLEAAQLMRVADDDAGMPEDGVSLNKLITELEKRMRMAAKALEFEDARGSAEKSGAEAIAKLLDEA